MFNRKRGLRRVAAIVSISSLVTGCGILSSDGPQDEGPMRGGDDQRPQRARSGRVLGRLLGAVPEHLPDAAQLPQRSHRTQPDAAEQCSFTDSTNQVYRCALREGLTFSNGDRLDARAVKYSIDRIKDINVNGWSGRPARQPRTGPGAERAGGGLPPQQARRHLPVRARHARHVDRRPRRLSRGRLARRQRCGGLGTVHPPVVRGRRTGRTGAQRPLRGLRRTAQRGGDHPLLQGLRRHGEGAARRRHPGDLPRPRRRRRHQAPGQGGQGGKPPAGRGQRYGDQLPRLQPRGPVGRDAGKCARPSPR
ncbi:hypothetical protein STENM327S_03579 [Streptomyces tendae]